MWRVRRPYAEVMAVSAVLEGEGADPKSEAPPAEDKLSVSMLILQRLEHFERMVKRMDDKAERREQRAQRRLERELRAIRREITDLQRWAIGTVVAVVLGAATIIFSIWKHP